MPVVFAMIDSAEATCDREEDRVWLAWWKVRHSGEHALPPIACHWQSPVCCRLTLALEAKRLVYTTSNSLALVWPPPRRLHYDNVHRAPSSPTITPIRLCRISSMRLCLSSKRGGHWRRGKREKGARWSCALRPSDARVLRPVAHWLHIPLGQWEHNEQHYLSPASSLSCCPALHMAVASARWRSRKLSLPKVSQVRQYASSLSHFYVSLLESSWAIDSLFSRRANNVVHHSFVCAELRQPQSFAVHRHNQTLSSRTFSFVRAPWQSYFVFFKDQQTALQTRTQICIFRYSTNFHMCLFFDTPTHLLSITLNAYS